MDTQNLDLSFNFSFPHELPVHGSANGLLLLVNYERIDDGVRICDPFICNPITREYIRLPSPTSSQLHSAFGFGVSNVSGEYKVIAAFIECCPATELVEYKFKVDTLGTGSSWRSTSAIVSLSRLNWSTHQCVFLNGKLHWKVEAVGNNIECFDLETERFSTFSAPELVGHCFRRLYALGDHGLYLCDDNVGAHEHAIIWMMKEYGDDKSWTKEFLIKKPFVRGVIEPIKIFKDGDMMMAINKLNEELCLYHYSTKTKTFREINLSVLSLEFCSIRRTIYTPSFFPLKTFSQENVSLF